MKKINLILSAVAAVALLASCSNGSKDYKNVKSTEYKYAYTVTGSMTTTDKNGTTTAFTTDKTVQTIKSAVAECSYDEDSLNDSNYDAYKIKVKGTADYEFTTTPANATTANPSTKKTDKFGPLVTSSNTYNINYTVQAGWYSNTILSSLMSYASNDNEALYLLSQSQNQTGVRVSTNRYDPEYASEDASGNPITPTVGGATWIATTTDGNISGTYSYTYYSSYISDLSFTIQDFDGDYFIQFNNEFIALPEDAFDGFIGDDEFTLTFSTTQDNRSYLNETDHTNAANALSTTDVDYKLTFKLVEAE